MVKCLVLTLVPQVSLAVRFIHCSEQQNTEQLHQRYNIIPLNIFNRQKALKTWETIRLTENALYEELVAERNNSHTWFPKSSVIINSEVPEGIITRQKSAELNCCSLTYN